MRAHLIAVGERMPAWVQQGFAEYAKRLSRELPLDLVEVCAKSRDPARAMSEEAAALLAAIPKGAHVVALDGRGKPWSSAKNCRRKSPPSARCCKPNWPMFLPG